MTEKIRITPLDKSFTLFRCIHVGPLSPSNIETKSIKGLSRDQLDRNKTFLARLADVYGSCAMVAIEKECVVAHARFYPRIVFDRAGIKHFCCQQPQYGVTQQMREMELPELDKITDQTLVIECWHVHKNYQSQGIGNALLDGIVEWAQQHGWKTVKASAAPDNYWVSAQACTLMLRTFIKHGFRIVKTRPAPELEDYLLKIQKGELGVEKRMEFEKHCGDDDLSALSVYHEVERKL